MMQRQLAVMALSLLLPAVSVPALSQETLNVVSWDGAYVRSQILGFIRPYEEQTGVRVNVLQYNGGIAEIRQQVRALNVRWDVVDLELFDAIRACEEGLLEPLDHDALPDGENGMPAEEDFVDGSLTRCGVGSVVAATVVSYDRERLEETPRSIGDFFDLNAYPGRRGLRRTPQGNLEWALIADGVSRDRVYEVLSTEEGLDRAFTVLDRIKPYTDWWTTGEEALRLLETGAVTMASVYSGRVHDAVQRGSPVEILWDHQIRVFDVWGVPRNGRNTGRALEFIRFATSTHSLARQAAHIPYGPARRSSMAHVPERMRSQLPTAEANQATALELDAEWWSRNLERVSRRFERWIGRPVMVPRDLPH